MSRDDDRGYGVREGLSRRIRSIGIAERRTSGKVRTKRLALSIREQAIEPSGRISEGKLELQKLLKIFLDKNQKHFSVGAELSLSTFLLRKDERALQILAEQQFLVEIKVA